MYNKFESVTIIKKKQQKQKLMNLCFGFINNIINNKTKLYNLYNFGTANNSHLQ